GARTSLGRLAHSGRAPWRAAFLAQSAVSDRKKELQFPGTALRPATVRKSGQVRAVWGCGLTLPQPDPRPPGFLRSRARPRRSRLLTRRCGVSGIAGVIMVTR